jgi:MoaA/NifB/PqqE/SkfB family radical SAM enzyme
MDHVLCMTVTLTFPQLEPLIDTKLLEIVIYAMNQYVVNCTNTN